MSPTAQLLAQQNSRGTYVHRCLDPALLNRITSATPDIITTTEDNIKVGQDQIRYQIVKDVDYKSQNANRMSMVNYEKTKKLESAVFSEKHASRKHAIDPQKVIQQSAQASSFLSTTQPFSVTGGADESQNLFNQTEPQSRPKTQMTAGRPSRAFKVSNVLLSPPISSQDAEIANFSLFDKSQIRVGASNVISNNLMDMFSPANGARNAKSKQQLPGGPQRRKQAQRNKSFANNFTSYDRKQMLEPAPMFSISGGDLFIEKGGAGFEGLSVGDPNMARH